MIPINENERIPFEDKDGVRYFFRALTGENEYKFYDILTKDDEKKPIEERRKVLDEAIDFVLLGWEPIGDVKMSAFKEGQRPSSCFGKSNKDRLLSIALDVNNIGNVDSKNS